AAVDLACAQPHQLLRGLRHRRLRDHQAGVGEPLAELGADLVVEHVEPGFHDSRPHSWCCVLLAERTRDADGPVLVTAPVTCHKTAGAGVWWGTQAAGGGGPPRPARPRPPPKAPGGRAATGAPAPPPPRSPP